MTGQGVRLLDFRKMVDSRKGTVAREIFSDEEIYKLELERIFARAWNFMAHETQIPNPGDFFQTFIGEEKVICVRDKGGQAQVLLNTCRHRGNAVCRADEGRASSFMCTYHGWTYDLQGKLVGVPGFKSVYHEELDREEWSLIRAPKIDSYKGFIFATMDPDAPDLEEYLGEVGRMGLSMLAERGEEVAFVGGIQKYTVACNWKLAVDNVYDFYHFRVTHSSALMARAFGNPQADPPDNAQQGPDQQLDTTILGEYGHAIGGDSYITVPGVTHRQAWWRERPETKAALGPVGMKANGHPNIFPNSWIATTSDQLVLRLPKGPLKTEMWLFTLLDKSLLKTDPKRHAQAVNRILHGHGPAGMIEQDDTENWAQSTSGVQGVIAQRYPLNYGLNLGHGETVVEEGLPPYIESKMNEYPQLWTWRCWADWMCADTWEDLKANHTPVPLGTV